MMRKLFYTRHSDTTCYGGGERFGGGGDDSIHSGVESEEMRELF